MKQSNAVRALVSSFESSIKEANSQVQQENEYEIYGRYVNLNDIERLARTYELQEQYNIQQKSGSIRVRYVKEAEGEEAYILTSKQYAGQGNSIGVPEVNIPVNSGLFEHFKAMASSGMIKRRYFIPIGKQRLSSGEEVDIEWEVDVFLDAKGETVGWVKIDLPVIEELKKLPPLPFDLDDKLELPLRFSERSSEDKTKVHNIIDSVTVKGSSVSLENGDMMAYKQTEKHIEDGEFVSGMLAEFKNDNYTDKGPCTWHYLSNTGSKFTFSKLDDGEMVIDIDFADITLTETEDGAKMLMIG